MGKSVHYVGESARSFHDRTREHLQALNSSNEKYAIVKHWKKEHTEMNDPPDFKFEVLSSHMTAIQRQLSEGLAIEAHDPETLINGKGEYGSNRIPRYKMTLEDEILGKNQGTSTNIFHPKVSTEGDASRTCTAASGTSVLNQHFVHLVTMWT